MTVDRELLARAERAEARLAKVPALVDAALELLTWAEEQRLWKPDDEELMPAIRGIRAALAVWDATA